MIQRHLPEGLAYETQGEGQPVLLVHGFAGTARTHFDPLLRDLARDCRVIAPDLRGHGRSAALPRQYDADLYRTDADDLVRLLDQLALDAVHLVGYSDGGETAILLAARLGARVRSATVWGVSGRVPPPAIVALYADPERCLPDWPALRAELEEQHGQESALPMLHGWAAAMRTLAEQGGAIEDMAAAAVVAPVLVVAGDHDPFNPLEATRALVARLPTARLVVLPGAGHDLLRERGPQLTALIRRMLASPDR